MNKLYEKLCLNAFGFDVKITSDEVCTALLEHDTFYRKFVNLINQEKAIQERYPYPFAMI